MKTITIYTNGISNFTLENYDKIAGVSHANGITVKKEVSQMTARAMHSRGQLHYILGIGDRKVLKNTPLNRRVKLEQFQIS